MTDLKTDIVITFKDVVRVWWKFFWRYAVLLSAMLVANGIIINRLAKAFDYPSLFYWGGLYVSFMLHLLVSFLIFNSILGKQVGKSGLVFVPSTVKQRTPENQYPEVSFPRTALTWWNYFWRFALFAFAIAFTLGALLPIVGGIFRIQSIQTAEIFKIPWQYFCRPSITVSLYAAHVEKRKTAQT